MNTIDSSTLVIVVTSITGLVGAITGLISVWVTYLNYVRDNAKIRVRALKNMKTFIPGQGSSEKSYLIINAANAGRRTVIINKAAFTSLKIRGGGISSDSMKGPVELKEGKAVDYMMEEDGIDYSNISHVSVYDSVGNEYRCYLAPWYQRFLYWFLDATYIRRKPLQAPKRRTGK